MRPNPVGPPRLVGDSPRWLAELAAQTRAEARQRARGDEAAAAAAQVCATLACLCADLQCAFNHLLRLTSVLLTER